MAPTSRDNPVWRWFAGLVEVSFQERVGLSDPGVLDYLTDLLTAFIHTERISLLGDGSGRKVTDVAEMLTEAQLGPTASDDERRRSVYRHIGDFTLFWTGVYPESLRRMHRRAARDDLLSYLEQGKRSYSIASDLSTDNTEPPARLLTVLSDQFEFCVYGLGLVRREWERGLPDGVDSKKIIWS